MKLYLVDNNSLDTLKQNLPSLLSKFSEDNCEWVDEVIGHSPFVETRFKDVPSFTLDMSADEPFKTDGHNAEIVYENLKFLSDSQASDERFWAALCLREYWPFVQYRWELKTKGVTEARIKQHVFFGYGARRSLTRNTMSRLWWAGRLTVDPEAEDPYRLTRFACENADTVMHALERNTSNSRMINRAFLSAVLDARDKEGLIINTDIIGDLAKYLNLLGGTYILDCLPEQFIYDKIMAKAREIDKREKAKQAQKAEAKEQPELGSNEQKAQGSTSKPNPSKRMAGAKAAMSNDFRSHLDSVFKKKHSR